MKRADLSLIGTDELVDEVCKRALHGVICLELPLGGERPGCVRLGTFIIGDDHRAAGLAAHAQHVAIMQAFASMRASEPSEPQTEDFDGPSED